MGKNNQQRRAAKKQQRNQKLRNHSAERESSRSTNTFDQQRARGWFERDADIAESRALIERGVALAELDAKTPLHAVAQQLLDRSARTNDPDIDPGCVLTEEAMAMVSWAWEHGWQPLDVVHLVGRKSGRLGEVASAAVREQAKRTRAYERAPRPWLSQLDALDQPLDPASSWRVTGHGTDPLNGWCVALQLMVQLRQLYEQPLIGPPPSKWPQQRTQREPWRHTRSRQSGADQDAGPHDAKMLGRIRALLAKAEATEYAAEAEAFTAKAQDLMTRHSISEALLRAEHGAKFEAGTRRVHINNPYALTKASLLNTVGQPNRVRAVWDDHAGFATIIGAPVDLEQVEMLFTSLLIQATRAMTEAGESNQAYSLRRSTRFRRSFLSGYAVRIGQRLSEANEAATAGYGAELVPVFSQQRGAIDAECDRLFPNLTSRGSGGWLNAQGWQEGTAAADQAVFPAARIGA